MSDHYHVLNVSGGLSSAYMLWLHLEENGGQLADGTVVLFANTGKEREETLQFVDDLTTYWGVPITWLEYRYHPERRGRRRGEFKNDYQVVGFDTASRDGKPFDDLILGHRYLPTQNAHEPELAEWWIAKEHAAYEWRDERRIEKPEMTRFSKRHSFEDLLAEARQPQMFDVVNLEDEPAPDCWCGD